MYINQLLSLTLITIISYAILSCTIDFISCTLNFHGSLWFRSVIIINFVDVGEVAIHVYGIIILFWETINALIEASFMLTIVGFH